MCRVTLPEFERREAGVFAKLLCERALVAEAEVVGDLGDGPLGAQQCFARGLNASFDQELLNAQAKDFTEFAVQLAR